MPKQKRLSYGDLKPKVREHFKLFLVEKEEAEGLILPQCFEGKYSLEAYSEPNDDTKFSFFLCVPADIPQDTIMLLEADVSRIDGSITNWHCHDEHFVPPTA